MNSGIYTITNTENGKQYVGSTDYLDRRFQEHLQDLRLDRHSNIILQRAYDKYGKDSFKYEILERCENCREAEQKLLDTRNYFPPNGYNISQTACGGITWDESHPNYEEIVQSMSDLFSGKGNGMYNMSHSSESIQLMKKRAKNRFTLEWFIDKYGQEKGTEKYKARCKRISDNFQNPMNSEENRAKLRGPRSEATKQKLSNSLTGRNIHWGDKISEAKKGKHTGKDNWRWISLDAENLKSEIKKGKTYSELADTFDCSESTIVRRIKKELDFSGIQEAREKLQ